MTNSKQPIKDTNSLSVRPLTSVEPAKHRSVGRPGKLVMPALPAMDLSDTEQALFDYFQAAYREQYPDLTPTDLLMLHLAGIEYIKYLRVAQEELASGKVISMARQHPGVQMRSLLDQLSVTRKARVARTRDDDESEEAKNLREFFMRKA